jgi:protein-S-isoprenylcysteine O-methyltransferase Ste14
MPALVFWSTYLLLAFVITPAIFRWRFGRWPFAYPLHRPDTYLIIDFVYGATTIGFTVCLFITTDRSPRTDGFTIVEGSGFLLGTLAVALILIAIASLGESWRIGQDREATDVRKVRTGPYRYVNHPIYIGLIMLSIAMILLAGATICTVPFAALTLGYAIIQGRSESRQWRQR